MPIGLGIGLNICQRGGIPGSGGGASLTAPVLTLITGADDNTPLWGFDLFEPEEDDVIRIEWDDAIPYVAQVDFVDYPLTAADLLGDFEFDFGLSAFADGPWSWRAYHMRGVDSSAVSNEVTLTISTAVAPANTVAPVISGNLQVGQTLTTTDGTWTGTATITYTYQWKRGGSDISGETNNTYLLAEADAGQSITCVVTGTNGAGNDTGTSNALVIDVYAVYLANLGDPADATTYSGGSWNGISFGVAAANRKLVLGVSGRQSGGGVTGITATIGGNATSNVVTALNSAQNAAILHAVDVAAGTSGNIAVTFNTAMQRAGMGLWAVYGATASATDTDSSTSSGAGGPSVTLTVPAGGVAIGISYGGTNPGTCTWTGMSGSAGDFTTAMESTVAFAGAHLNSAAGGNIVMESNWTSEAAPVGSWAAFGHA